MKIVALIPSFGTDPIRLGHQKFVTQHYRDRWGMPTVLGTDRKDDFGRFSRARAINNAARRAIQTHRDAEAFLVCDNDAVPDADALTEAMGVVLSAGAVTPHRDILDLTLEETERFKNTGVLAGGRPRGTNCLGCILVSVKAFKTVNGMDELFTGWGAEDNAFVSALERQVGPVARGNAFLTHLWHPRDPTIRDRKNLLRNRRRAKRYANATPEESRRMSREYGFLNI